MARPRAPNHEHQREQILARAAALFARRGYSATSMNEVAEALGVSKPALYHYVRDKHELLLRICMGHIERLEKVVYEVEQQRLPPEPRVREMVRRFVLEYANAQDQHRVLTEDVRFLDAADRERVIAAERRVVAAVARALAEIRSDLDQRQLVKPLTMLLFGMINWMFTWLRPGGTLTHEALAPIVSDLFFGGIAAVDPDGATTDRIEESK